MKLQSRIKGREEEKYIDRKHQGIEMKPQSRIKGRKEEKYIDELEIDREQFGS